MPTSGGSTRNTNATSSSISPTHPNRNFKASPTDTGATIPTTTTCRIVHLPCSIFRSMMLQFREKRTLYGAPVPSIGSRVAEQKSVAINKDFPTQLLSPPHSLTLLLPPIVCAALYLSMAHIRKRTASGRSSPDRLHRPVCSYFRFAFTNR